MYVRFKSNHVLWYVDNSNSQNNYDKMNGAVHQIITLQLVIIVKSEI